jgi:dTDP-4-amino-4,6-dideoxygalactose transaminase
VSTSSVRVPFVALQLQHRAVKAQLLAAVDRVFEHGQYVLGPEVEEFESRFASLCGVPFAVGMSDGTHALLLTLRALGIGAGDEVITAPNSFLASAASIALVGARPVFADVRDDLNLDPERVAAAVSPRTRAIMPVHLTGRPADMRRIGAIAERHGLHVVEDAAQAVGATFDGRAVGSLGAAGCFSLHPLKNLAACGDAGVVTTSDRKLADAMRVERNHGLRGRDDCGAWGYNARLDTLQAALLNEKLPYLGRWTAAKRQIAARYRDALGDAVAVPEDRPGEHAVYQTFVIRADRRDDLQRHLASLGVDSKVHYPTPLHLQEAAAELGYKRGDFPVTERLATEILSLPIYPELTEAQQEAVVDGVLSFYGRRARR